MSANSKKLHGNGRWESSRMMLPEHREQYVQLMNRERIIVTGQIPKSPPASQEELQLMQDYVLLPMAYAIVEKNRKQIEGKARSLRDLFVKATDIVLHRMYSDIESLRQELKRSKINIVANERIDGIATYTYKCRSHNGGFAITREYARTHIGKLIARYINGLFK
ncbi:hypothetical protein [Paenibacillus sp. MMO-58]|uniref:hypothetical protein n=1 Tax=Paenibacillus sp. MMO-58 TaxID=3081290 RepID=UPI0030196D31